MAAGGASVMVPTAAVTEIGTAAADDAGVSDTVPIDAARVAAPVPLATGVATLTVPSAAAAAPTPIAVAVTFDTVTVGNEAVALPLAAPDALALDGLSVTVPTDTLVEAATTGDAFGAVSDTFGKLALA